MIVGCGSRIFQIVVVGMVFVITACSSSVGHQSRAKQYKTQVQQVTKAQYREMLALHSEIPDPLLGFVVDSIVLDDANSNMLEVVYKAHKSTMSQQEIRAAYVADMELIGWQLVAEFSGDTRQMIFERPRKAMMCTVTLYEQDSIKVTLFQGQNKKDL
ncbi:hypothetical protein KBD08_01715 [Candidatus Babeliales bacterium]|nr:hypothetical protein [Candidatus Babeliales bacterium]